MGQYKVLSTSLILCYIGAIVYAVTLFGTGFLLSRTPVLQTSSCAESPVSHTDTDTSLSGCWAPTRYQKAIVLIIDAWRLDFAPAVKHMPSSEHTDEHARPAVSWAEPAQAEKFWLNKVRASTGTASLPPLRPVSHTPHLDAFPCLLLRCQTCNDY